MIELRKRWSNSQVSVVLADLRGGKKTVSPFGQTPEGKEDLRGISIGEPIILNSFSFERIDFSSSEFVKIVCINCKFSACNFDDAKLVLLSNGGSFDEVSFFGANLSGMAVARSTNFEGCDFSKSNLSGSILRDGIFDRCNFSGGVLRRVEFGASAINGSVFSGEVVSCFFRGLIGNCDFESAVFLDCSFYGSEFENCRFSSDVVLVKSWPHVFSMICAGIDAANLSDEARRVLKAWCGGWGKLIDLIKDEVIDRRDLNKLESRLNVADEIFDYIKGVSDGVVGK